MKKRNNCKPTPTFNNSPFITFPPNSKSMMTSIVATLTSTIAVNWLALLVCICAVPNLNYCPQISYSDRLLEVFPSPSQYKMEQYLPSGHNNFLLHSFQCIIHQSNYPLWPSPRSSSINNPLCTLHLRHATPP